jgi:hypothetical protein
MLIGAQIAAGIGSAKWQPANGRQCMTHRVVANKDEGLLLVAVLLASALIFFALVSRIETNKGETRAAPSAAPSMLH